MTSISRHRLRLLAAPAVWLLLLAGCSSEAPDPTAASAERRDSVEPAGDDDPGAPGVDGPGDGSAAAATGDDVDPSGDPSGDPSVDPGGDPGDGDVAAGADDAVAATTIDTTPVPTTTDPPRPDDGPDAPPTTAVGPSTTRAPVTVADVAQVRRVVSLSATHTETLFAIGAGDLLVAVDVDSDFPEAATALQAAGLTDSLAEPGPILALDPDLVIVGADPTGYADRLTAAGLPVWRGPQPDDVEGALAQIVDLGATVGRTAAAEELVASMRAELERFQDAIPPGTTYFHEIDPSGFTVVTDSFLDSVYGSLGLVSVVPPGGGGSDGGGEDFVRVEPDRVPALDPDVIVLADAACCGVTAERVAARPGWSGISAVRTGTIAPLPDGVELRWGVSLLALWGAVAAAF